MVPVLNIFMIATLAVMGIAIWQCAKIAKKGKTSDNVDPKEIKKLELCLNVIHIGVYALVVILVFRIYLLIAV